MNQVLSHPFSLLGMTLAGLIFLFLGERILTGLDFEALLCSAVGVGILIITTVLRASRSAQVGALKKNFVTFQSLVLLSGVLALINQHLVVGDSMSTAHSILDIAWLILLACSLCPLLAIDVSRTATSQVAAVEKARTIQARNRGLAFGLLLCICFTGNFLISRQELRADLSFGKKAQATEQTKEIVRDMSRAISVTLYYPRANEVSDSLQRYFASLEALSSNLTVRVVDHALATEEASEAGVNGNGYVVVTHETNSEKIKVGTKLRSARTALRKFDANFAKAIVKVSREKAIAYFTVGHGERSMNPTSDDKRSPVRLLKQQLQANRYEVKPLGIAEGLGHSIPKDASIVFILGPEKPFLAEEIDAIRDAVHRGVRILVALEAERESVTHDELLSIFGLKFNNTLLANERGFVRVTGTKADRNFLYSNRYSSHASVTTMTRHSNRLATLFARSGYLSKTEKTPKSTRVDIVLRSLDESFADINSNLKYDSDSEAKKSYDLAAAVTRTSTRGKSEETRVFVLADVDTFSDKYVKYQGNPYLLGDIIYWLRDIKEPVLPTVSEADVRIVHKRDEDALWFYSTILGMPFAVFGFGLVWIRRRNRA